MQIIPDRVYEKKEKGTKVLKISTIERKNIINHSINITALPLTLLLALLIFSY